MDNETKKILDEGKVLKEFISHEGYAIAKAKLFNRVSGIIDIHTMDMEQPPQQLAVELKARTLASQIILDWFRIDPIFQVRFILFGTQFLFQAFV